jgi:hypothetical protein
MSHQPYGKTVWILGAGFSRSLGGPLMNDLLAYMESDHILEMLRHPAIGASILNTLAGQSFDIRSLFAYGIAHGYWQHAEHFLDICETALADQTARRPSAALSRVKPLLRMGSPTSPPPHYNNRKAFLDYPLHKCFQTIEELVNAARRAVAGDCWAFLKGADVESERWSPYVQWAEHLNEKDMVLTFNYDQVPDMLADRTIANTKLSIINPHKFEESRASALHRKLVPVLKLHGSTAWTDYESDCYQTDAPPRALTDPTRAPLMGFPGPGKMSHCRNSLRGLWTMAKDAILAANTIIFIGYRFPPSDSFSRQTILEAISSNRNDLTQVITILGDNLDHPDARRLESLLLSVRRIIAKHRPAPLFCEDFLDEFHRPV